MQIIKENKIKINTNNKVICEKTRQQLKLIIDHEHLIIYKKP